ASWFGRARPRGFLRRSGAQSLALEHLDERGSIQTKKTRSLVLVPTGALQRLTNELVLEGFHRSSELEPRVGKLGRDGAVRRKPAHARRQIVGLDGGILTEDRGALDGVLELAHVTGPVPIGEELQRGAGDGDVTSEPLIGALQEVLGEHGNVFGAVAQ